MRDPNITFLNKASGATGSRALCQDEKMFFVRCAISAHSLLRLAPKKAMANTSTGMAINKPRIGIIVKLTTVRAKPVKSKNRPTAKSETLSK